MGETMRNWMLAVGVFGALVWGGCGEEKKETTGPRVVSGFSFEITVDPSTLVPAAAEAMRVAADGSPDSNPPDTIQLYTPNDTLGWQDGVEADYFSFDVDMTNFYRRELCALTVVVDEISPENERYFALDDRGYHYAEGVTGAGVWFYGDLEPKGKETRRWTIALENRESFTLRGRVLADDEACVDQE